MLKTGERVVPENFSSVEEYLCYLRHRYAYEYIRDQIPDNSYILEIGSGEGYGSSLLSTNAAKLLGVDVDDDAVSHAISAYSSDVCYFRHYDGQHLPTRDESVDVVVTLQVIEHIEDDHGFVKEIYRVLKPGGMLFVSTPNRIYRLEPGQKPWNRFHVREYYPEEFRKMLVEERFEVDLLGVKGKGEVQAIELAAVKKGFHDIDKLNLRRIIPDRFRPSLARLVRFITGRRLTTDSLQAALDKYDTGDYFASRDDIDGSLDLLAACRKTARLPQ